jgi:hypothetical protein
MATFPGTNAPDTIQGGSQDDLITGAPGADTDAGAGGAADNDSLFGGGGTDSIYGGGGNDTLNGEGGNNASPEILDGGDGNDLIYAGGFTRVLEGGDGSDTVDINALSSNPENIVWTETGPGTNVFTGTADNGKEVTISGAEWFIVGSDTLDQLPCYAEGTLIATARGEVAVEDLLVGDLVVAAHGGAPLQPVVWIGHSKVAVAKQRDRAAAAPILIKAGALAEGVPHRDLRVSPEHAMFLDGRLVPAKHLVNGTTIIQEFWCPEVTYWHVELPAHGLLVAEGAVSESYFDDGNRKHFDNGAIATLFKDFESERHNGRYAEAACYPLLNGGEALDRLRARLDARAAAVQGQGDRRTA